MWAKNETTLRVMTRACHSLSFVSRQRRADFEATQVRKQAKASRYDLREAVRSSLPSALPTLLVRVRLPGRHAPVAGIFCSLREFPNTDSCTHNAMKCDIVVQQSADVHARGTAGTHLILVSRNILVDILEISSLFNRCLCKNTH